MSKKTDTTWHLFLYAGLIIGAIAAYLSRFNSSGQFFVLVLIVTFYLLWGYAYHNTKGDVNRKLYLEYIVISLIALGAGYLVLMN